MLAMDTTLVSVAYLFKPDRYTQWYQITVLFSEFVLFIVRYRYHTTETTKSYVMNYYVHSRSEEDNNRTAISVLRSADWEGILARSNVLLRSRTDRPNNWLVRIQ